MSHCFERFDDETEKAKKFILENSKLSDPAAFAASLNSAYEILDCIFKNEDRYRLNLYEQAFAAKRSEADQLFYTYFRTVRKPSDPPKKATGDASQVR